MKWMPIETAPKDGTQYLAFGCGVFFLENRPPNHFPGEWTWNASRNQWRGHAHLSPLNDATHWMPLPEPPKEGE